MRFRETFFSVLDSLGERDRIVRVCAVGTPEEVAARVRDAVSTTLRI